MFTVLLVSVGLFFVSLAVFDKLNEKKRWF